MTAQHFIPRRWLRTAFAVLLCLAGTSAAQDLTSGDFSYSAANGTIIIMGYTGLEAAVTIPSSINGYPVKKIGNQAFTQNGYLTSVTIPDSVISIGDWAFLGCSSLISITIPNGVTSIGEGAFINCSSLTSITIPNSVTSIGYATFGSCSSLISITIPDGITSIEPFTFSSCSGLTNLTIGSGVTSIGNDAFNSCTGLTSLTIPNSVTSIGDGAFRGCTSLTSLTVPDFYLSSLCTLGNYTVTGINGPLASKTLIDGIARNLSTNTEFINALAGNDAFVTAVANKIKSTGGNYGIATQSALSSALTESRADGINSVLSNPSLWTLYTTSQIQNMAVGDLVLTKNVQGNFTLNYDIEQSTDLQTWTPYQALSLPLTGLPTDKAFVRIKAKP